MSSTKNIDSEKNDVIEKISDRASRELNIRLKALSLCLDTNALINYASRAVYECSIPESSLRITLKRGIDFRTAQERWYLDSVRKMGRFESRRAQLHFQQITGRS